MNTNRTAKLQIVTAMFLFGTIGIFVRHIALPSSVIALARGAVGSAFLLVAGVLHTGVAYYLHFGSMAQLPGKKGAFE